jgi:hypothetical protein
MRYNKIIIIMLRFLLSGIFVFSGIMKMLHLSEFSDVVLSIVKIDDFFMDVIVVLLPLVEIIFGFMFILNYHYKIAIMGIIGLLIVFIVLSIYSIVINLNVNCGCFGRIIDNKLGSETLIRNLILLGIGVYLFFNNNSYEKVYS